MLGVSCSPDPLLKSNLRHGLARLCEDQSGILVLLKYLFLEKETLSHAWRACDIYKHHKGRLLRENSFFLEKTFSIIPFFSLSFFFKEVQSLSCQPYLCIGARFRFF